MILIKPEKCKVYFNTRERVICIMCPPAPGKEACCFFSDIYLTQSFLDVNMSPKMYGAILGQYYVLCYFKMNNNPQL